MFRYLMLSFLYLLFSCPGVAQDLAEGPTGLVLNDTDQHSKLIPDGRSAGPADARISIRRLKVPRKAQRLYEKAMNAWMRRADVEAQRNLDQALELDPTFAEGLTLRGCIQATNRQWTLAEQSLQAAIHSDPSYPPAYVILAGVYNTQDRYDEAQIATEHALSAGATVWSLQYEIARALIGKRQYENALAVSEAALRSPHGSLMHLAKAHAMVGLGKYPEAAAELRTYLRDDPAGEGSQDARRLLERLQSIVPMKSANDIREAAVVGDQRTPTE